MASTSVPSSSSSSSKDQVVIYSKWYHPEKTWLDIFVGLALYYLGWSFGGPPPEKLKNDDDNNDDNKTKIVIIGDKLPHYNVHVEHAKMQRQSLTKMTDDETKKGGFHTWSQVLKGERIFKCIIRVPHKPELMYDWGLLDKNQHSDLYNTIVNKILPAADEKIPLHVYFPETLLPNEMTKSCNTINDVTGVYEFDDDAIQLDDFDSDIPMILFLHGGGMTIGCHQMCEGINILTSGLKQQDQKKYCIYASLDYSQAPEYQFPTAPLETCAVIQFITKSTRPLHILGVSAGGNLALTAGLECCLRQQNRMNIQSIYALAPFLDPATNSKSYYENSQASTLVNTSWLTWCWQVYLGMLPPQATGDDSNNDDAILLFERTQTNATAWKNSPWNDPNKTGKLRRWINPIYDISDLSTSENDTNTATKPRIVITTNAADPLYQDGYDLVQKLKRQKQPKLASNVHYVPFSGSHWLGHLFESKKLDALALEWCNTIFGNPSPKEGIGKDQAAKPKTE